MTTNITIEFVKIIFTLFFIIVQNKMSLNKRKTTILKMVIKYKSLVRSNIFHKNYYFSLKI